MTPEQFLLFAEVLPEAMLLVSSSGRVIAASRAFEDQLGINGQSISGRQLHEFVAAQRDEISQFLQLCSATTTMMTGGVYFIGFSESATAFQVEGAGLRTSHKEQDALLILRLTRQESSPVRPADLEQSVTNLGREIHHRTQADEATWQHQERLRVTLQSIGDGVIVTDMQGKVAFLNPVAESLTGWTNADAVGQPLEVVFVIVNETTRRPVDNPAARAVQDGIIAALPNHTLLISKDGRTLPIDDSAAPIKNERAEMVGAVLVFRDVTERKRVEKSNRKNEEIFRLVHQIGKIGHWEWNADTDENIWSPEIEALYGLPPGGFEGGYDGWAKLLHPDDLAKAEADIKVAFQTGEYFSEFRVVWPDGSIHWLETRAWVFKDANNRPQRIVGVNMDITEQKKQQEELQASEKRWRTMAETLPNLVWTDLPNGQCDWLSSQWRQYTGYPESELLGIEWLNKVVHPDDREKTINCWTTACADEGNYDVEFRIRRHDGEYRWFKTRGLPVRDERGKIVYWFGTCTDVEDFKRLEGTLREADRKKDEFLATLSHELRNPLAPIRNSLEVLKRTPMSEEATRETYAVMGRQLNQMVRLIDDLLDISRISRGKLTIKPEPVDLAQILRHAIETCRPVMEDAGHKLTIQLPTQPIELNADFARLSQVFSNLLNNACKFTPAGGHILLVADTNGCEAVISLTDNGIGIPSDQLTSIFEVFSQVDSSLNRSQGGLGIGLSLVREVVRMHGGDVVAQSEGIGTGSKFTVRLPTIQPATAPTVADRKPVEKPDQWRILVVDDNHDSAVTLSMLLKISGHHTQTAHDGLEAVTKTEAFQPDVVLLDIGLPKMNGYEACRKIREQDWGQEVVIIALTGWGQEDDRRKSREAGFNGHLVKPVEHATLTTLLSDLVRPRSQN